MKALCVERPRIMRQGPSADDLLAPSPRPHPAPPPVRQPARLWQDYVDQSAGPEVLTGIRWAVGGLLLFL